MKRLAMIAATGIMAFMISACGDNAPQKPEVQADDMQPQVQQPAAAAPEAAVVTAPAASDAPVDATETQPAQPTEEAISDAAVQE